MRAWLCLAAAAALALCLWPASAEGPPGRARHDLISAEGAPERARLDHIKRQILSKLGLGSRPPPLHAPPRDVVRQILARAADDGSQPRSRGSHGRAEPDDDESAREIIAIAKRANVSGISKETSTVQLSDNWSMRIQPGYAHTSLENTDKNRKIGAENC